MLYVDGTTFAVKKLYVTKPVYISDYIHRAVFGGLPGFAGVSANKVELL